jgi:hypothetical protein
MLSYIWLALIAGDKDSVVSRDVPSRCVLQASAAFLRTSCCQSKRDDGQPCSVSESSRIAKMHGLVCQMKATGSLGITQSMLTPLDSRQGVANGAALSLTSERSVQHLLPLALGMQQPTAVKLVGEMHHCPQNIKRAPIVLLQIGSIACGAGHGVIHQHWKRFSSCSLESGAIGLLLADL